MITEIEDFFNLGCGRCERFATSDCSVQHWQDGLAALRTICLNNGLVETVKWGHPCYMHATRNIVLIGAFRSDFRLSFFNAALMQDPNKVLEKAGPNTPHPDVMRFVSQVQVTESESESESTINQYLQEAMSYAEAGIKPAKIEQTQEHPEELQIAFSKDPELEAAFYALTPGRQRSYLINLSGAKKSETRTARISKFRAKILNGKGATER